MKNIYFVQPNNSLSGSLFLPYAAASLAAYVFNFESIKNQYRFCGFIFTKSDIAETVASLDRPYFIGFSSYMWNIEYNLALAKQIKKKYPSCIIAFGGPSVPDDTKYLEEYPFIDILMHGEGEISLYKILSALSENKQLYSIENISFVDLGKIVKTEKAFICSDLSEYPSPYVEGYFDSIISDLRYEHTQFDAILETNRGCPYKCTYCCWAGTEKSFRSFSLFRVKADLDWMAKNKIPYCICADSNFGILDRDKEIAEYIVNLKKKYGYPQKFETTAAKNKNDFVFQINEILESAGLNRGVSVAVQSMSPIVLENVGRKNICVDDFSNQLKEYREKNINTYTDIILGLPGETYESFCKGLFDVIEAGQHTSININRCEILPNTVLYSKKERNRFKIKTIKSHLCQNHSEVTFENAFGSRSEIVVETSTMSRSEWRNAIRLSTCVQSFHCMGLLKFVAIYLRKAKGISYYNFYISLYNWIEEKSRFVINVLNTVCMSVDSFLEEKSDLFFFDKDFGNIFWSFDEGLFLRCVKNFDEFYADMSEYISVFFDNEELYSDLIEYQKRMITRPFERGCNIKFLYDWHSYFENSFNSECVFPERKAITLYIKNSEIKSWSEYAKRIVWFGRRSNMTIRKDIG